MANSSVETNSSLKNVFDDFYEELRLVYEDKLAEASEATIEDFLKRTSNYIMQRLHSTLYSACQKITTNEDSAYAVKVTKLQWVEPHHLEVPAADKTVNWPMWRVSVREL